MKQLERFLGCLTYASDFIRDIAKWESHCNKNLKEVSWTLTPSDSKIVQNFKKMCKNLPILNLPNEGDDLILKTDASDEH